MRNGWRARWLDAVESSAVRHRNILVLSPWSLFPAKQPADYRFADRWRLLFDLEGLAGGPGRAFDVALKVGYDVNHRWGITAGYRTVEGGADIEEVYNFAWFQYAVVSGVFRF